MNTKTLKANEDVLNKLHKRIADKLLANLESDECTLDDINAAMKFLKDNNIKADLEFNSTVKQIEAKVEDVKKLPFPVTNVE